MKRLVTAYTPIGSAVQIVKLECEYKVYKEPTTFAAGQKEGVHAIVHFRVVPIEGGGKPGTGSDDVEAVEFTFVMYDVFDRFLTSIQGLAGPGYYKVSPKKKIYSGKWVFTVDGGFSQYHALCFPSQIRFTSGKVWRIDRNEIISWLNETMTESGEVVQTEDVFPDGVSREGYVE